MGTKTGVINDEEPLDLTVPKQDPIVLTPGSDSPVMMDKNETDLPIEVNVNNEIEIIQFTEVPEEEIEGEKITFVNIPIQRVNTNEKKETNEVEAKGNMNNLNEIEAKADVPNRE